MCEGVYEREYVSVRECVRPRSMCVRECVRGNVRECVCEGVCVRGSVCVKRVCV